MSRADIRHAVETFFEGTDGFRSVFGSPPKAIPGSRQPAAVCHIHRVLERRTANQTKLRTYTVYLMLDLVSKDGTAQKAQARFDDLMEALEARLRQGKTLGSTNIALGGEPTFESEHSFPVTQDKGAVHIAGILRFDVDEFLSGV